MTEVRDHQANEPIADAKVVSAAMKAVVAASRSAMRANGHGRHSYLQWLRAHLEQMEAAGRPPLMEVLP